MQVGNDLRHPLCGSRCAARDNLSRDTRLSAHRHNCTRSMISASPLTMSKKILRFPDGRPEPETLRRPRLSVSVTEYFRSALAADPAQRPQLVRKRPTRFEGSDCAGRATG